MSKEKKWLFAYHGGTVESLATALFACPCFSASCVHALHVNVTGCVGQMLQ